MCVYFVLVVWRPSTGRLSLFARAVQSKQLKYSSSALLQESFFSISNYCADKIIRRGIMDFISHHHQHCRHHYYLRHFR